jgi:hypothetical protein
MAVFSMAGEGRDGRSREKRPDQSAGMPVASPGWPATSFAQGLCPPLLTSPRTGAPGQPPPAHWESKMNKMNSLKQKD